MPLNAHGARLVRAAEHVSVDHHLQRTDTVKPERPIERHLHGSDRQSLIGGENQFRAAQLTRASVAVYHWLAVANDLVAQSELDRIAAARTPRTGQFNGAAPW